MHNNIINKDNYQTYINVLNAKDMHDLSQIIRDNLER